MAGRFPTDTGAGTESAAAAAAACLKAGKKSSTCWVATPGHGPRLVWASWLADAICLVTDGGEQQLPGLSEAVEVTVTLQTSGASTVTVLAEPNGVEADDPLWTEIAGALAERRLNGAGTPAELVQRWAAESTLTRLVVTGSASG